VPSARLERATYCSASKRSNPLSYEGIARRDFTLHADGGQGLSQACPGRTHLNWGRQGDATRFIIASQNVREISLEKNSQSQH
jgi:hypothetical protein